MTLAFAIASVLLVIALIGCVAYPADEGDRLFASIILLLVVCLGFVTGLWAMVASIVGFSLVGGIVARWLP